MADEACDISTKEQMALVIRFVDSEYNIREEFLRFIHCSEGLCGKDLCSVLMKCITEDLKLDIKVVEVKDMMVLVLFLVISMAYLRTLSV